MREYKFKGKHLIAEYYNLDFNNLACCELVNRYILEGIELAGANCIGTMKKEFEPEGYTIVALLLESHVSVHAYPEQKSMFIDAFTCGDKNPLIIHEYLMDKLNVKDFKVDLLERGNF
jgi:S-adenosylmethionine decarboxylase proenzyme